MMFKSIMRLAVVALAAVACTGFTTTHAQATNLMETNLEEMQEFNGTVGVVRVAGFATAQLMNKLIGQETTNVDKLDEHFSTVASNLGNYFYDRVAQFSGSFENFYRNLGKAEGAAFKDKVRAAPMRVNFFAIDQRSYRSGWQFLMDTMTATCLSSANDKLKALHKKYQDKVGPAHLIDLDNLEGGWETLDALSEEMMTKGEQIDSEFRQDFGDEGHLLIISALRTHFGALYKKDPTDPMFKAFDKVLVRKAFGESTAAPSSSSSASSAAASSSESSTSGSDSTSVATEAPTTSGSTEGSGAPVTSPVASSSAVPSPAPTSGASAVVTTMAASAVAVVAALVL